MAARIVDLCIWLSWILAILLIAAVWVLLFQFENIFWEHEVPTVLWRILYAAIATVVALLLAFLFRALVAGICSFCVSDAMSDISDGMSCE